MRHVFLAAILLAFGSVPASASIIWSWSFGGEAGTFETDGVIADTAFPGVFSYREGTLDITASDGGNIQSADPTLLPYFGVGSEPTSFTPGDVIWSGAGISAFDVATSITPTLFQANANSVSPLRPYIYQFTPGAGLFREWTGFTFTTLTRAPISYTPSEGGLYSIQIDRFDINYAGGSAFVDDFDDGTPPPAPGYAVLGTVGPETGGTLTLDETGAVASLVPGVTTQVVDRFIGASTLDDVLVVARYDLSTPHPTLTQGQNAFLSYVDPADSHIHTLIAAHQTSPSDPHQLLFTDFDVTDAFPTLIDAADVSSLFTGPISQIDLIVNWSAGPGTASVSISAYNGGIFIGSLLLPETVPIPASSINTAGFQTYVPEPGMNALLFGATTIAALGRRRNRDF